MLHVLSLQEGRVTGLLVLRVAADGGRRLLRVEQVALHLGVLELGLVLEQSPAEKLGGGESAALVGRLLHWVGRLQAIHRLVLAGRSRVQSLGVQLAIVPALVLLAELRLRLLLRLELLRAVLVVRLLPQLAVAVQQCFLPRRQLVLACCH